MAYTSAYGFDSAQPPRQKRHNTPYKYKARDLPTVPKSCIYKRTSTILKDNAEKEGSDFSDSERSNGMPAFDIVDNKTKAQA